MDSGCCMTFPSATGRLSTAPRRVPGAELSHCVVVQEPVHLSHSRHNSEFWAALGSALPDYEAARRAAALGWAVGLVRGWALSVCCQRVRVTLRDTGDVRRLRGSHGASCNSDYRWLGLLLGSGQQLLRNADLLSESKLKTMWKDLEIPRAPMADFEALEKA